MNKEELKSLLNPFLYNDYIKLLEAYRAWLRLNIGKSRVLNDYNPEKAGEIFVLSFRFNQEEGFNDVIRNNDLQVIVKRTGNKEEGMGILDYFSTVTMDPKTRKEGIAHFANQVYTGNIGFHQWAIYGSSRICIRSDAGCWYFRTGVNAYTFGCIGLNKHNSNYFWNSSLGCEIYADEQYYKDTIKPLLKSVVNKNNIPCAIIDLEFTDGYFK